MRKEQKRQESIKKREDSKKRKEEARQSKRKAAEEAQLRRKQAKAAQAAKSLTEADGSADPKQSAELSMWLQPLELLLQMKKSRFRSCYT